MTYEHFCGNCLKEFEAEYSIKAEPPTVCPLCGHEGKIERLISGGNGKGKVKLSGRELVESVQADAKKLERHISTNENAYANIIGESKYEQQKTAYDRARNRR